MRILFLLSISIACLGGCRDHVDKETDVSIISEETGIRYATGFSKEKSGDTIILTVTRPWPGADQSYTYYLVPEITNHDTSGNFIETPVERLVVTSTTHIPSLEMLGASSSLVGFPGLDYISSEAMRARIDSGFVREVGSNERLNSEVLIELDPDLVVGFAVEGAPSAFSTVQKAGIPVVYNADWTETHPLGKAEWIKFFGALLGKSKEADSIFAQIEKDYLVAKKLAQSAKKSPTVISGAMYRDIWYAPAGQSWAAQFINDANGIYVWKESEGTGSLSLSLESALDKGQDAEFWIAPGQFATMEELVASSDVYAQFEAYKNANVFTFSKRKGLTGGVLYYELAPNRPDLVLKDLIAILHPELIPDYQTSFFDAVE